MGEYDDHRYSGKDKRKQRLENHLPEWIVKLRDEYIRQSEMKDNY